MYKTASVFTATLRVTVFVKVAAVAFEWNWFTAIQTKVNFVFNSFIVHYENGRSRETVTTLISGNSRPGAFRICPQAVYTSSQAVDKLYSVAAPKGFEPLLCASKARMLPLHQRAISVGLFDHRINLHSEVSNRVELSPKCFIYPVRFSYHQVRFKKPNSYATWRVVRESNPQPSDP